MTDTGIKLTIAFTDSDLEPEEREEEAQRLMADLKQLDEVDAVERVPDPNPPEESMAFGSFLVGILMTKVSVANGKKLLAFLGDRLGNKPIELSVEANGKKLSVKASSREELEAAVKVAQDFINS
jgi:hypothetical protein